MLRPAGGADAAFQRRELFLEGGNRRIGDPRVDVAEIFKVEALCGGVGVREGVGGCLLDRRHHGAARGVRRGSGMDRLGLKAPTGIERWTLGLCHSSSELSKAADSAAHLRGIELPHSKLLI
jgi:hypothetical protein